MGTIQYTKKINFDKVLNLVSVVLVVYIAVLLVRHYMPQPQAPIGFDKKVGPGQNVKLAGVTWPTDKGTLVLALQVGCKYCAKSMPFYRKLVAQLQEPGKWHVLAVLPQPTSQATDYLNRNGVNIHDVHQGNLQDLGVSGTPTLLLVNTSGKLIQSWAGALDDKAEQDVALHMGIALIAGDRESKGGESSSAEVSTAATSDPVIYTSELQGLMRAGAPVNVIDVRKRNEFAKLHIAGALNIPVDELAVRLPHEVGLSSPVIVYCGYSEYCALNSMDSLCQYAESEARSIHITMRAIRDKLPELKTAGVLLSGQEADRRWEAL